MDKVPWLLQKLLAALFGLGFPASAGRGFPLAVGGAPVAVFSLSLGAPFGSGNMYMVTLGSVRSSPIFFSIGNRPAASG